MSKSNNEVYIPLSDTNIVNLAVREDFFPGNCNTCEYGQKYVQDVRFEAEDDRSFVLEFEDTSHYPVGVAEFTQLLINNLDRYETMDYAEFKAEMKDLEDRAFSDIKQKLNPQEIGEI